MSEHSLFYNMVVLSRAFWVQDGRDRDFVIPTYRILNGHKTVSAKRIWIVVIIFVGVSPVGALPLLPLVNPSGTSNALSRLYNVIVVILVLFQARFLESRRSASEAREHTSVCDRSE